MPRHYHAAGLTCSRLMHCMVQSTLLPRTYIRLMPCMVQSTLLPRTYIRRSLHSLLSPFLDLSALLASIPGVLQDRNRYQIQTRLPCYFCR